MQFVIRTDGQAQPLADTLRREVAAMASGNAVSSVIALEQIVQIGSQEIAATAFPLAPLILIAMLLTAAGVYGVLAFAVSRRATEFAVRSAIGARRVDLICLIAAQSARVISFGLFCGVGIAFALTRLAQGSGGIFDSPGWRPSSFPCSSLPASARSPPGFRRDARCAPTRRDCCARLRAQLTRTTFLPNHLSRAGNLSSPRAVTP